MTAADDLAVAAFVTGAMINSGASIARGILDPTVPTFNIPGMGRVRLHIEAIPTDTKGDTDGTSRDHRKT